MAQKEMRHMMKGAAILTIASFIAKLLSAVYRVPFQNLVGDEGFYVYQQVYPIYGIAMTLALTGLPQFVSKYVAEKTTPSEQKKALKQMVPILATLSLLLWAGTLLGSGVIAKLMGDSGLKPLIQIVSFTFLLMPGLSYYRGYFQGQLQMMPTAISQVLEQLVRVGLILLAAYFFQKLSWDIYQTGSLAMLGAVIGGLFALLVLYRYDQKINGHQLTLKDLSEPQKPSRSLLRRFLIEGGLVSIYSGYLIAFQLIDSFFVKNSLVLLGLSEHAAKVNKGIYDRGQPLVQLGLVVATALSATFLPALTKQMFHKNFEQFEKTARIYLRLTVTLAAAASVGLAMLMPLINFALFKDFAGNGTLVVFVFSVGLMATIQAYQSIAQSQNNFRKPLKAALLGLSAKLLTTGPLTCFSGTVGASLSTILGLIVVLLYMIRLTSSQFNFFWKENSFSATLFKCLGIMVGTLFCLYGVVVGLGLLDQRSQAFMWAIAGVFFGGSTFITAAVRWKLFTIREWLMFPMGDKILRLMKRGK